MNVIILCALLTALVTILLVKDIENNKEKMACAALIPVLALGLYTWLGSPDTPASAAMYERTGPAAQYRGLLKDELSLMAELAEKPDDINIILSLGAVRLRAGRLENAIKILEHGLTKQPDNHDIRTELGAAYYASALSAATLTPENKTKINDLFEKAMRTTPEDAEYRSKLERDYKTITQ